MEARQVALVLEVANSDEAAVMSFGINESLSQVGISFGSFECKQIPPLSNNFVRNVEGMYTRVREHACSAEQMYPILHVIGSSIVCRVGRDECCIGFGAIMMHKNCRLIGQRFDTYSDVPPECDVMINRLRQSVGHIWPAIVAPKEEQREAAMVIGRTVLGLQSAIQIFDQIRDPGLRYTWN